MRICVSKEIYPKVVVLKAAYQFTDRAYIYIQQTSEDYLIDMKPKDGSNQIVEDEFKNELLSQTLRHEVYLQTKEIASLSQCGHWRPQLWESKRKQFSQRRSLMKMIF